MTILTRISAPGGTASDSSDVVDQPTVFHHSGDLDTGSAGDCRMALRFVVGLRFVILDISSVGLIDAAGLGVLIAGIRDLHEHGGRTVVVARWGPILDLLERVGVTSLVPVFSTLEDATAALRREHDEPASPPAPRSKTRHP